MPWVRSIPMISARTTLLTSWKTLCRAPSPAFSYFFLLFILGKELLGQIDVEFYFSIGHALVIFQVLWIINNKCMVNDVPHPTSPIPKLIYIVPNTLFSSNLMIIISCTFGNTWNILKLYEITLFATGSSVYYSVYESDEPSLRW